MDRGQLETLALRQGIQLAYTDLFGKTRTASDEAITAVLLALGVESEEPPASPSVEPVVVAWDGVAPEGAPVPPGPYPLGYHEIPVEVEGSEHEVLVISAPRRSYRPDDEGRRRALFLPLYALRSLRAPQTGDYTALAELAEWAGGAGGYQVATLPLFASFLTEPCEPSPYTPASRLFLSELHVDPAAAPEFAESPDARRILEGGGPPAADHVDFRAVMAHRRAAIEAMLETLRAGDSTRRREFDAWVKSREDVRDYAAFRAAVERRGAAWPAWEEPARSGKLARDDYDEAAYRYHLYVQWLAEGQLADAAARARAAGSGLQLDLPVGAAGSSYDVWRHRHLFATGASTGAPPDDFFSGGQDWGFPPLHPQAIRRDGYRYLRRCLARLMGPADVLRIDHALGLYRLFFVPPGMTAKDGVYVRYPEEELIAVLSLESHRHRCRLVGEDLGTVPPEVVGLLSEHGIGSMYVLPFLVRPVPARPLRAPRPGESASLNTHDMVPFAGWWKGTDAADRVELGHLSREESDAELSSRSAGIRALTEWLEISGDDPVEAHDALVLRLAGSDAGQVVLSLEDLWAETRPQNWPGTSVERPNFSRTAAWTLEEIREDAELSRRLARIARARDGEGGRTMAVGPVKEATRLTDEDLYFFGQGTHLTLGDRFGAHPGEHEGEKGYWFSTWAPNAESVSVVGDFNGWDPSSHGLYPRGGSGVWEGFIPGVERGAIYKYRVASRNRGYAASKADPFGRLHETPPKTASVAWDSEYEWSDADWVEGRAERNAPNAPISVYEVHIGSWMRVPEEGDRFLGYREIAPRLADYVKGMGFTHVELMPVMEHPFYGSWGYQVTGFFAPSSRFGTPQDFMALVDHLHAEGIGVILDWVPSHFPRDEHGPGFYDGTHLYEHSDPRQGIHPDWGGFIFNYGRTEAQSFLLSAGMHWLTRFHADGLRTDAVASMLYLDYSRKEGEWIPNEFGGRENLDAIHFLRKLNEEVYRVHPDVQTIAEESTAWPGVSRPTYAGGLGFGMKWDMGWMHDTLQYFQRDPIHRKWHHHEMTFRGIYAFTENFMLPLSHDEVVHGKRSLIEKMPGDDWQKFANLRLLYSWMWAMPGKKLLFMGGEFAQRDEWNHDKSLDWHLLKFPAHSGVQAIVRDLNRLYRERPALHARDFDPAGFEWVEANDAEQSVYAFLRRGDGKGEVVLCVFNATPTLQQNYRVGVPTGGEWKEILNGDAKIYGGSGQGNFGGATAKPVPLHGRTHSLTLTLPPLAAVFLEPETA